MTYSNLKHGSQVFKVRIVDHLGKPLSKEITYAFSIEAPFYYQWWFLLVAFSFIGLFFILLIKKTSRYNKDFVKNFSETTEEVEETKTYFLVLGMLFPITEILNLIFKIHESSELLPKIITGVLCLSIYFISNKFEKYNPYLQPLFITLFMGYTIVILRKIVTLPFDLLTFSEILIILFFSYNVFKKINHYLLFVCGVIITLIIHLISATIGEKSIIVLINSSLIILLINYARRIAILNTNDRLVFSNNIINNSNSISIAFDKFRELTFCSNSIEKILGYRPDEVLGDGTFIKLNADTAFQNCDSKQRQTPTKT